MAVASTDTHHFGPNVEMQDSARFVTDLTFKIETDLVAIAQISASDLQSNKESDVCSGPQKFRAGDVTNSKTNLPLRLELWAMSLMLLLPDFSFFQFLVHHVGEPATQLC